MSNYFVHSTREIMKLLMQVGGIVDGGTSPVVDGGTRRRGNHKIAICGPYPNGFYTPQHYQLVKKTNEEIRELVNLENANIEKKLFIFIDFLMDEGSRLGPRNTGRWHLKFQTDEMHPSTEGHAEMAKIFEEHWRRI